MTKNTIILNRLFTQTVFFDMISASNNATYGTVIQRFVNNPEDKNNGTLISEVYRFMSKAYRNEYFYQNTLLNKLLLGKHSINTTTALTQVPIRRSKACLLYTSMLPLISCPSQCQAGRLLQITQSQSS